MSSLIFYIF